MRKSRAAAAETRRRIVEAASCAFREKGIVATGLAELMKAAGLTHGGFYKHFESKDQLVAEACAEAARAGMEAMGDRPTVGAVASSYLSATHRDDPASGCLFAAIGSELARADEATREAATVAFKRFVDALAGGSHDEDARRRVLAAVSTMIGAVTISRIVTDPKLSKEILDAAEKSLAES